MWRGPKPWPSGGGTGGLSSLEGSKTLKRHHLSGHVTWTLPPSSPQKIQQNRKDDRLALCGAGSSGRVWGSEPEPAVGRPGPEGVSATVGTALDIQSTCPCEACAGGASHTPSHAPPPPKPLSQSAPCTSPALPLSRASLVPLALMILILCPLYPWNALPFPNSKGADAPPLPVTSRFQ